MAYTPIQSSWDRRKDTLIPFWLAPHGILQEVDRINKPTEDHHPLAWADRPITKERLKALWIESAGKPLAFARLIELEHGIKEWDVDEQ